ncbi:MAG: succinate dehydrogenase, cytochrome b556 subunit [Magnetospirillum sp. WYHS-4]
MNTRNRPLSPHLQIYRPQITSVLSILHRLTGAALWIGALAFTYWLAAAVYGPEAFNRTQVFLASWFGRLILFGWTFCLFYHLSNGVRHIAWDYGWGFELKQLRATGGMVVAASLVLTLLAWIVAYAVAGGHK